MAICDWPADERPREKLLKKGASALSDSELLAIFLRTGVPGKTALDLAREMIQFYGGLKGLLNTSKAEFCCFPGMGDAKFAQLQASLEMTQRYFHEEMCESDVLTNPEASKNFVRLALAGRQFETFACVYLNSQHQMLGFEELFQGTLDAASVYPREVVRQVLAQGAGAVIFCHNHPSGSTEVSKADRQITKRLAEALALIDVKVLDHLIVAGATVVSFAELGLI